MSEYRGYSETLQTIARIYDVGAQYLAMATGTRTYSGLPRTFDEYVRRLYGVAKPDRFLLLNYGLLAALIAFVVVLVAIGVPR